MNYSLKTIFDRFEKDKAVLITPWGQEIFWPKEDLPGNLEPGSKFFLALSNSESKPIEDQETMPKQKKKPSEKELAQLMLEELLNGEYDG